MNTNLSPAMVLAIGGLTFFGIALLLSSFLKITGGRFWSLPFRAFMDEETEIEIGLRMRETILKYAPMPFLFFIILFFYLLFFRG